MQKENWPVPRIGEVYYMCFDGSGSEQRGWRPGLIFQNNLGNLYSPNVIALPMTSSLKKLHQPTIDDLAHQPTHVLISANDTGLRYDSVVLCENPQRMSKELVGNFITALPISYMRKIAEASLIALSAISFLDAEALMRAWKRAVALNSGLKV